VKRSLSVDALADMRVSVSALIGHAQLTLGELLTLNIGSVVPLQVAAGDAFPLLVNGVSVGSGDVVTLENGCLGLLIHDIRVGSEPDR